MTKNVEQGVDWQERAEKAESRIAVMDRHRNAWRRVAFQLMGAAPKQCPHACQPPCPFDRAMEWFRAVADLTEAMTDDGEKERA